MSDALKDAVATLLGRRPVIRTLASGDLLPASFALGFNQLGQLDPQWVWVAEHRGRIMGCIVASPCHGVALIWRLVALDGNVLLPMLRAFMRDLRSRGLRGYMTIIDPEVPAQDRLRRIVERGGGKSVGPRYELLASPLVREGV